MNEIVSNHLANRISELLIAARTKVLQTVNITMVMTYFEIGRMIVEEEQKGKENKSKDINCNSHNSYSRRKQNCGEHN